MLTTSRRSSLVILALALAITGLAVACAGGSHGSRGGAAPEYEPPGSETPATADAAPHEADAGGDAARVKPTCVEGWSDGGALDAWVRREAKTIFLDVPALAVHEKWLELDTPLRCDGDPRRATPRLTTVCSAQETSFTLDLTVEDGALITAATTREYGGKRTTPLMQPRRLPCGAHVVFHGLTFRDPKWKRLGSPCISTCLDRSEACARPCAARFTNADEDLTAEGAACMQRCTEAEATCMEHCPPG